MPSTHASVNRSYKYKPEVANLQAGRKYTWKFKKSPAGVERSISTGELPWAPAAENNGKAYDFETELCDEQGNFAKQSWQLFGGLGMNPPLPPRPVTKVRPVDLFLSVSPLFIHPTFSNSRTLML